MARTSTGHARANTVRFAVYNHKGGVGKTTLSVNVGAALAELGWKVLLVDSDPQCNLTGYLISEDVLDNLLDESDTEEGQTIWSALQPVSEASGPPRAITPIETSTEGVYLLPGDIRLSEFENDLNEFWTQCLARKVRGFRGTTALSDVVNEICLNDDFDFVIYDTGPNIGPLNRAILLDCDGFVVPVACDLFSLRAIKTLTRSLVGWIREWQTIADLAPEGLPLLPGLPKFVGYVPTRFKVYGGRAAREPSSFLSKIRVEVEKQLVHWLGKEDSSLVPTRKMQLQLGEIKDFGVLVTAAQDEGKPIWKTRAGTPIQRDEAKEAFEEVASVIASRLVATMT